MMPETSTMIVFAVASFILVIIPGPAVIYILTRSVSQGRTAGLVSAAGVNVGSAIHVLAAVAGLSVIIASSQAAFAVIKWAGVCYLAWIGYRTLTSTGTVLEESGIEPVNRRRIFVQGVLVNVLNPKVALFFLAFLPQFVNPTAPDAATQYFVLGMTLVTIGLISDSVYALVGSRIGDLFRSKPGAADTTRVAAGVTYFALAGVAAFTGTRH